MSLKRPTVDEVVSAVNSALEGDNRHGEDFYPKWNSIENFIPKKDKLKAVKALADSFDCDWEGNLQYVVDDGEEQ